MALELDLPYETIDRIDNDHNRIKDKCYDMFYTWLQRSPDACWCHIVKALKICNMLQLANDIEESFLSEEWTVYKQYSYVYIRSTAISYTASYYVF